MSISEKVATAISCCAIFSRSKCSPRHMKRFFPIIGWLPEYRFSYVKNDLIAGITVGLTLVPQALAFAQVANLPPEYGLYSSFIGLLVYTLLGTSKDAGIGPTNLLSMLIGQVMLGLNTQNPIYTSIMSFICGFILMFMGFLRLGFLINMFSIPVISGFTSAAGLIIIINQLSNLFGIHSHGASPFHQLTNFARNFTRMNFGDLILGLTGLVFLIIMQRMPNFSQRRFNGCYRRSVIGELTRIVCASRNVILVLVSTLFAFLMETFKPETLQLTLIGKLPAGLPIPKVPNFFISNVSRLTNETHLPEVVLRSFSQIVLEDLNMSLLVIPLMAMLELFAITKALGRKNHYKVDHSQDLVAVGVANLAGSFFGAMPITAAATRSALNDQCRVSTPLAGTISAVIVIISSLFATPVFSFIPKSILAAIIISAGISLIDLATVAHVWHEWRPDLLPLLATFIVALCGQLWQGIIVGLAISLAMLLAPMVRLKIITEHLSSEEENGEVMVTKKPTPMKDFETPAKPLSLNNSTNQNLNHQESIESTPFQTPPSIGEQNKISTFSNIIPVKNGRESGEEPNHRIVIVRLQQGLLYPSVDRFTDRMSKILARDAGQIVIDCQFITGLDFTALQGIRQVLLLAYRLNRSVVFAKLSDYLRKHIERLDIDHFRHVSRWDELLSDEGNEELMEDWDGTRSSLNGSAFGELNVDAMLAKRSGKLALEDLTPIPEESQSESQHSIEAVVSIPKLGSPSNKVVIIKSPSENVTSGHGYAVSSHRLLTYEPHFFGSAIPLAIGSVSMEDINALPKITRKGHRQNSGSIENFLRGSRHVGYTISDYEDDDSESSSERSSGDSDKGLNATSQNHLNYSSQLLIHDREEHVELLEFTTNPYVKHGHAASAEKGLRIEDFQSVSRGYRLQTKTVCSSHDSRNESSGKKKNSESHPQLSMENECCAYINGAYATTTPKGNVDTWHGDALMSKLARSLSHHKQDSKKEIKQPRSAEPANVVRHAQSVSAENSALKSVVPSFEDTADLKNEIHPAVIVHSADDVITTKSDKLD